MLDQHSAFLDPAAIANYTTDTPRKVPGLTDLHRMATLLLDEQAPRAAHVLVVGAGGGLELVSLAAARPDWRFTGVDPSPAMLDLAREAVAPFADRVQLVNGIVAPSHFACARRHPSPTDPPPRTVPWQSRTRSAPCRFPRARRHPPA